MPNSWERLNIEGIDSEIGGIITNQGDTLIYDLGWYTFDPQKEDTSYAIDLKLLNAWVPSSNGQIPPDSLYVDKVEAFHTYEESTIDCFSSKLIKPIHGRGEFSGVFVDSLSVSDSGTTNFGFYGRNLSDNVQNQLFAAIKTIAFSNYCK